MLEHDASMRIDRHKYAQQCDKRAQHLSKVHSIHISIKSVYGVLGIMSSLLYSTCISYAMHALQVTMSGHERLNSRERQHAEICAGAATGMLLQVAWTKTTIYEPSERT